MKRVVRRLRSNLRVPRAWVQHWWRKREKELAWPDVEFIIDHMPRRIWGGVGGDSQTGWAYQQGFFAALIQSHVKGESLNFLDFGCGIGKLTPISLSFTHPAGRYVGVDIMEDCIAYCREHYADLPRVDFALSREFNATYSASGAQPSSAAYGQDWPVEDDSIDIVTAVSVFTHLQETDAHGYMAKLHAILKPGGVAFLTFHIVEEPRLAPRFPDPAKLFDFHTRLPASKHWFTSRPARPEDAIAVNMQGLESLIADRFDLRALIRGSTTGGHDPFFQDLAVLRRRP